MAFRLHFWRLDRMTEIVLSIKETTIEEANKFNQGRTNKSERPDYKPEELCTITHLSGHQIIVFSKHTDIEYIIDFIKKAERNL